MKRLLLALAFLLLPAQAFASSCVISEHSLLAPGGVQIAKLPALTTPQNIATSASSAQSSAFTADTQMIRAWCDTQSAIEIGANPTASATVSVPLSAGVSEYFNVAPGQKAAFILRP